MSVYYLVLQGGVYVFRILDYYSVSGPVLLAMLFMETLVLAWVFGKHLSQYDFYLTSVFFKFKFMFFSSLLEYNGSLNLYVINHCFQSW